MNSLFLALAAYLVSYLIIDFLCQKLGINDLINCKTSRIISLLLIAVLFGIVGTSIIESFTTREYHLLFNSLLFGATTAFIVFILPVNNTKTKR